MIRFFLTALTVVLASFLTSTPAFAQPQSKAPNTLKISPVRTDIEIVPGAKKVVQITATNLDTTPVTVRPVANDFVAGDERGTPALILDDAIYAPTHSLKRFMSPLQQTTIPAQSSKTINVVVSVPQNAQAGGYFGSLRLLPVNAEGGGQVNLSPSIASLILLKVPGAIVEDLRMTDFKVGHDDSSGFYFKTPNNLRFSFRFENKGNVQTAPLGSIAIQRGGDVMYEDAFNTQSPHDTILPDSARRWDIPIRDIGPIGYYTATATFTYGESNQTVTVKKNFLVAPLWVVIVAGVVVLLLVGGVVFGATFAIKRFNGRVARKRSRGRKASVSKTQHHRRF